MATATGKLTLNYAQVGLCRSHIIRSMNETTYITDPMLQGAMENIRQGLEFALVMLPYPGEELE